MIARASIAAILATTLACKKDPPRIVADEPAATSDASVGARDASDDAHATRVLGGDCLSETERLAHLERAWLDGDRVVLCLGPDAEQSSTASLLRECFFVDAIAGEIRRAPTKPTPKTPKKPRSPYAMESADGKLTLLFSGGLRGPHDAMASLVDAKTWKTIKTDFVPYDEHVAFEGWIGNDIVLRTWVDEGPGCVHTLIDPTKAWPPDVTKGTTIGASCYAVDEAYALSRDRVGFVDGEGTGIVFVDAATLEVRELHVDHEASIDEPNLVPLNADGANRTLGMLLAYGNPSAGDVVEIDLEKERVVREWTPKTCEE